MKFITSVSMPCTKEQYEAGYKKGEIKVKVEL